MKEKLTAKMIIRDIAIGLGIAAVISLSLNTYTDNKLNDNLETVKIDGNYNALDRVDDKYDGLEIYLMNDKEDFNGIAGKKIEKANINESTVELVANKLDEALSALPKDIFEIVGETEMYVCGSINDGGVFGFAMNEKFNGKNIIFISVEIDQIIPTTRHEMMHIIDNAIGLNKEWNYEGYMGENYRYKDLSTLEFITNYASYNKKEDIAETFAYTMNGSSINTDLFRKAPVLLEKSEKVINAIQDKTSDFEWILKTNEIYANV